SALLLEALTALGMTELFGGGNAAAHDYFETGLGVATSVGDEASEAVLLSRLAIESVRRLDLEGALSAAGGGVGKARLVGDPFSLARSLDGLKLALLSIGDFAAFEPVIVELEGLLRDQDDPLFLTYALAEHAVASAATGAWALADELMEEAVDLA